MLKNAWNATIVVRPIARNAPNRSGARTAVRRPRQAMTQKQASTTRRADQPELLADHGVDEVVVRLGQVEQLLHAAHQPAAEDAAGARRRSSTGSSGSRRRADRAHGSRNAVTRRQPVVGGRHQQVARPAAAASDQADDVAVADAGGRTPSPRRSSRCTTAVPRSGSARISADHHDRAPRRSAPASSRPRRSDPSAVRAAPP